LQTEQRHRCPWPGCSRQVLPWFWGCEWHWAQLPATLRDDFIRTRIRDAEAQPVAHQMAIERIRNWVSENAPPLQESTATADVTAEFSAGFTADGDVMLFWPLAGEYLILNRREAVTLRRLFHG
jgi:hypothetical protein